MHTRRHLCLTVAILFLLAASVVALPPGSTDWPQIHFEKYKLKNGLEVILSEDHRLPLVAVNLWYHVGPMYEKPGRTGFAHLFEHMMFQGSKNVGDKSYFKYLEAAGASDINGTTDFDRTNYFETLPSNQLELALWGESDRMGFLLETLDGPKLANQRDVVRNERRESTENAPYGLPEEAMIQALYPAPNPYHGVVIGSHADIEAANLNDVREFFRQYYIPNNASIVIVGDFDPASAKQMVEKYFGPIPAGPPIPPVTAKTLPITQEKRLTVNDEVELPRVYMLWLTPPYFEPGDADADMLAHILGGGKSSRLYKKLVYELQIAQDVDVSRYPLKLDSMFTIQATCKPGVTPEKLEQAINQELATLRKEGPTPQEVDMARNTIQSSLVFRLERLGGVANLLNLYNQYLGDPGKFDWDLARYDSVNAASLKQFAASTLTDNSRVVLYAVKGKKVIDDPPQNKTPEKASTVASLDIAGQGWRKTAPKPGPPSKLTLPVPKQFTLQNGLTVLLTEQHNLPVVAARLVALGGGGDNPADRPGLAGFTARMLTEGTQSRTTLQIAGDAAQIGARLDTGANTDQSWVTTHVLKRNIGPDFDLLSDVVLHPAFNDKDIERIRNERATALLQINDDPQALANRVALRILYGNSSYGFPRLGSKESIQSTTRSDLEKFWSADFGPANSALVIAGDVTEAEARSLGEKYFGTWKDTGRRSPLPEVMASPAQSVYLVDKPGAAQSMVIATTLGVPRNSPDYAAQEVANATLGGLFSSRINMNLREKNGYTYGAFSFFDYHRAAGPFYIMSSVRTDTTDKAVSEMLKEVAGMQTSPVTPAELALAKDATARSLAGLFETDTAIVGTTGELFVYGLPLNFYSALPAQVDAVTGADVERMAKEHFIPGKMFVVVVGDKHKIESGLTSLGLGKVQLTSFEGVPTAQKNDSTPATTQ